MQLGESEPLRVLDNEDARVRHVHADLDDRGRDKQLDAVGVEPLHHRLLLRGLHGTVEQPTGNPAKNAVGQFLIDLLYRRQATLLARLDERADDISLPSRLDFLAHKGIDLLTRPLIAQKCPHGLPSRRQVLNARNIEITIHRECHCARNRGRRHNKHIGGHGALFFQCRPLCHTKAVLLVRHHKSQRIE